MQLLRGFSAFLATLVSLLPYVLADFEHLVNDPSLVVLPQNFETLLSCEMNIKPDKFQWKFYPSDELYNSQTNIPLNNSTFVLVSPDKFRESKAKSELTLKLTENDVGDYQCLAYYGASVVASVPWRVTLAHMGPLPHQDIVSVSVQAGNTVSWRCDVPESNPPAYVDYQRGDQYIKVKNSDMGDRVRSMTLANVTPADSNTYKCTTTNMLETKTLHAALNLEVLQRGPLQPPTFISRPLKEYTGVKGSNVFLECSAVGNPVPDVRWFKGQSPLRLSDRIQAIPGGLHIKGFSSKDDGVYTCTHTNSYGNLSHHITVKYNEAPSIRCNVTTINVTQEEDLSAMCDVFGTPEPHVAWFLNGFSVSNDTRIEEIGNRIYFQKVEKRHAGNLQIFARNIVKTVYSIINIRVVPIASTIDEIPTPMHHQPKYTQKRLQNTKKPHKQKQPKMIPPSRPVVSRINDETVVIRWNVTNNNGLPISFFKVQTKDLGPANHRGGYGVGEWETANSEIQPEIRAYEYTNLKPDHFYKFRVAAVYTNNDSKMSAVSKKFHLRSMDFDSKNPLPTCMITRAETVNHTAIRIYWDCSESNTTIDGFYIHNLIATRAGDDWRISTVDGKDVRSFVIGYLQPDSSYDFKLQSFNQTLGAGEFSPLMKGRTGANPVSPTVTTLPTTSNTKKVNREPSTPDNSIYIIIAAGVIAFALVITGIILLFVCRKWRKSKLSGDQDKPAVEHHIQADGGDYVVEPKAVHMSNGCALPGSNRITITSNPLAEADKNPTVIEMRNLANNNVRHQPDSPDGRNGSAVKDKHVRHKNKNHGRSREDCSTGSNYV